MSEITFNLETLAAELYTANPNIIGLSSYPNGSPRIDWQPGYAPTAEELTIIDAIIQNHNPSAAAAETPTVTAINQTVEGHGLRLALIEATLASFPAIQAAQQELGLSLTALETRITTVETTQETAAAQTTT